MNDSASPAAYLAVRRRLRHQPRGQPRDLRPDRTRPDQRDVHHGGRPRDRPRRGRRPAKRGRRQPALRDRVACHADRAVSPPLHVFPPARRRHVPVLSKTLARGADAPARSRDHPGRIEDAACGVRRAVRPRARFRRRAPARAALSAGARRVPGGGEGSGAFRLGPPVRPQRFAGQAATARARRCCSTS